MTYVTTTTIVDSSTATTTKDSSATTTTADSSAAPTTKVSSTTATTKVSSTTTTTKDSSAATQDNNYSSREDNITKEDNFIIIQEASTSCMIWEDWCGTGSFNETRGWKMDGKS
jgi:hypothetical protein